MREEKTRPANKGFQKSVSSQLHTQAFFLMQGMDSIGQMVHLGGSTSAELRMHARNQISQFTAASLLHVGCVLINYMHVLGASAHMNRHVLCVISMPTYI